MWLRRVGVGFNQVRAMLGTRAVIGINGVGVKDYTLSSKTASQITPNPTQHTTGAVYTQTGGATTLSFSRPLAHANVPITESGNNLIVAHGSGNTFEYHESNRVALAVNMFSPSNSASQRTAATALAAVVAVLAIALSTSA